MKRILVLALFVAAAASVGCGRAGRVSVSFRGTTPATSASKDTRSIEFHCPACGFTAPDGTTICSNAACRAKIEWPDEVGCGYCGATGECPTCKVMNQVEGKCYNCAGAGTMVLGSAAGVPIGQSRQCANCKDHPGKCRTCNKNPGKCDFCQGGKVPMADCKKRAGEAKKE